MRNVVDLPQSGRPDQHDEFVIGDLEVDALYGLNIAIIDLVDLADRDVGHPGSPCVVCVLPSQMRSVAR